MTDFRVENPSRVFIGGPISGGSPNVVLFLDSSGNLSQDGNFTYGSSILTAPSIHASNLPNYSIPFQSDAVGYLSYEPTLIWSYDTNSGQLGVGTSTFSAGEKAKFQGNGTVQVVAPTLPIITINYGPGGYTAGGFTHTYRSHSYIDVSGIRYYSPTYVESSPVTDDSRTITPDDVTGPIGGPLNYSGTGYIADGTPHSITVIGYYSRNSGRAYSVNGLLINADADDASMNPYSIPYSWDAVAYDGVVVVNENGDYIDLGNVSSFEDDNTLWGTPAIDFSNHSVPDDYSVGISVTGASGATGIVVLANDDVTPKDYDYYWINTGTGLTDNNDGTTPVISLSRTTIYDTSINATGNILFSGRILGSATDLTNALIVGQNQTVTGNNIVVEGYGNSLSGFFENSLVSGIGNTVVGGSQTYVYGYSNSLSTGGGEYQAVVGLQNSLSSDAKYIQILGYANNATSRLVAIIGQSNTVAATRAVVCGVANNVTAGDHVFVAGYQNTHSSSEAATIGYQCTNSGGGSVVIGYSSSVSGAQSISIGTGSTATGAQSYASGYGSSATSSYAHAIGFSCGASSTITIALGVGAAATSSYVAAICTAVSNGETTSLRVQGKSTSTGAATRDILSMSTSWVDSINAERRGRAIFNINDTAAREFLRAETSGTAPMLTLNNTRVADILNLGSEKLTNGTFTGSATGWTLNTGYAYSSNTVLHNANGTGTLLQTSAGMATPLVINEMYQLTYTISAWSVGTVTPACGGATLSAVGGNGTYIEYFVAASTADLTFTPTNTARFTIDTISLKKVQDGDLYVVDDITGGGDLVISGIGTFTGDVTVPDEAYGSGWNGSLEVPTKNAIYDKLETIASDVLFDYFTDAGNTGTGEDDLYSSTIAASQLSVNGQKIIAAYQGIFVGAAASTQELRIYFGGTKIYDSGALAIGVATNNWTVYVTCIRVSSSVVRCAVSLSTDFGTLFPYSTYTEVTGLTLTNTQILKLTGEAAGVGAANNQIVSKLGYVEFKPAA